jgi:hypothetical protein
VRVDDDAAAGTGVLDALVRGRPGAGFARVGLVPGVDRRHRVARLVAVRKKSTLSLRLDFGLLYVRLARMNAAPSKTAMPIETRNPEWPNCSVIRRLSSDSI